MKKSKTIRAWIVTYSILLCVLIVSMALSYLANYSIQKQLNERYRDVFFDSICDNTKNLMEDTNEIQTFIFNDNNIGTIVAKRAYQDYYKETVINLLIQKLSKYSNDEITYYVYIPNNDAVISGTGIFSTYEYYMTFYKNYGITYENWIAGNKGENDGFVYWGDNIGNNAILFHSYNHGTAKEIALVCLFSGSYLIDSEIIPEFETSCDVFLSDLNGNIFAKNKKTNIKQQPKSVDEIDEIYGSNWEKITHSFLSVNPFNITLVYDANSLFPQKRMFAFINIILLFLSVVIFLFIVIRAMKASYTPIKGVLSALGIEDSLDEFYDINLTIENIANNRLDLEAMIKKVNNEKKNLVLKTCMVENYSPTHIIKTLDKNNIDFSYGKFSLCVLRSSNMENLLKNEKISYEEMCAETNFILDNVFSELFLADKSFCNVINISETFVAIINYDAPDKFYCERIIKTIDNGLSFLNDKFGFNFDYVLSEEFSWKGFLSDVYSKTAYMLEYKLAKNLKDFIAVSQFNAGRSPNIDGIFDFEKEQKFINCILVGRYEEAAAIIDELIDELLNSNCSLEEIRCVLIDVACSFYKIPYKENGNIDFQKILSYKNNYADIREYLLERIKLICSIVKNGNISKADMIEEVVEYINSNFRQPINLNSVSTYFNVSSGYLSKFFKKEIGVSMLEYINGKRIEYAKELLRKTNDSIEKISALSGFGSWRTFNRVFQNSEGVSPVEFRKIAD